MKCFVTGAAGFIGSNLVEKLLENSYTVVGVDNLSTGKIENLRKSFKNDFFDFHMIDLLTEKDKIENLMADCRYVFHLSANADVRYGLFNPSKDVEQNIIVTHNVLEAMRKVEARHIIFSSTGSVYGEAIIIPTPEAAKLERQTSLYAASKVSAESLIQAYCEGFGIGATIYRFVSILGQRYSHGHVYDFYKQLKEHPQYLDVLGNGTQRKSYLHVNDCVSAMVGLIDTSLYKVKIYNLGTDETITVKESVQEITKILGVNPKIKYGRENQGWVGDNPVIYLDCSEVRKMGWEPEHTIRQGIYDTLEYLKSMEN